MNPTLLLWANLFLLGFPLMVACSGTESLYVQPRPISYTFTNNGKAITNDLRPTYGILDKGEALELSFRFHENLVPAEKLDKVTVKLYTGAGTNGPFDREWPVARSQLAVEYWNGKDMVRREATNHDGDWAAFIDPAMARVSYRESKIVGFTLKQWHAPRAYPEAVLQVITLEWKDRPTEVRSNTLRKATRSKKAFVEGRPFGSRRHQTTWA